MNTSISDESGNDASDRLADPKEERQVFGALHEYVERQTDLYRAELMQVLRDSGIRHAMLEAMQVMAMFIAAAAVCETEEEFELIRKDVLSICAGGDKHVVRLCAFYFENHALVDLGNFLDQDGARQRYHRRLQSSYGFLNARFFMSMN